MNTNPVIKLDREEGPLYLRKIDVTHCYLSNSPKGCMEPTGFNVLHVGQLVDTSYYNEVNHWLHTGELSDNMEELKDGLSS